MAEEFKFVDGEDKYYVDGEQAFFLEESTIVVNKISGQLSTYKIENKLSSYSLTFNIINEDNVNVLNEDSTGYIQLSFYDTNNTLVAPTSFEYRIEDLDTEEIIRSTTTISSPGSIYRLKLTPNDNAILDERKDQEIRVV